MKCDRGVSVPPKFNSRERNEGEERAANRGKPSDERGRMERCINRKGNECVSRVGSRRNQTLDKVRDLRSMKI